jgi:hypothetical protein
MDRRLLCDIPDLPINAFKHVGDKRIKPEGGGGGKGGGGSTTTVQQSVPKELVPYVKESIDLGRQLRETPYVPYQGQRIAGFTPEQKAVQQQVFGLQQPGQFDTAMAGAQGTGALGYGTAEQALPASIQRAMGVGDLGMNVAQAGLGQGIQGAGQAGALGMQTAQRGLSQGLSGAGQAGQMGLKISQAGLARALGFEPGTFGQREAQYYSSPYQQAVTDVALREAQRAADIERKNIGLQAAGRGTAGGSAEALQRAELARNLMQQRGDIQARGSESAFLRAQEQFERDRAAAAGAAGLGAQVGTSGLGNAIQSYLGMGQIGGTGLSTMLQSALGLGTIGQGGLGTAGQMAGTLGQVGTSGLGTSLQSALGLGQLAGQSQEANLNRLNAQNVAAQQIQAQNQKIRDQQYQDFLNQRDYGKQQLAFYSDLVRGNAPLYGTVQSTKTPAPSLGSQLGGLGLAGLSLYNLTK